MAQFSIKTGQANREIGSEKNLVTDISSVEDKIRGVKTNLRWKVASREQIRNRLGKVLGRAEDCKRDMKGLQKGLEDVVTQYTATENKLLGNTDEKAVDWKEFITDVVAEGGVAGSGLKILGEVVNAVKEPSAENWVSAIKDGWDTAWDLGDNVKKITDGTHVSWMDWLGLTADDALKGIAGSSMSALDKAKHGAASAGFKHALREFKTPGGCVKAVGGLVLSGIANGISNYQEYGGMTGRAVAETVTETAVDWGKDILIAAGVTAACAAAGVAAPAIAVGAATVAISVGADWVCKQVTGKGVTELVSDGILDGGTWVVKKAGDGIKAGWSGLKNGWSNLKTAFGGGGGGLEPVLS